MREALIVPMLPRAAEAEDGLAGERSAAEFALGLFERTMRDEGKALELRLDCAREMLNRTLGKPRVAETPKAKQADGEQVHIYMPDNGRGSGPG